MEQTAHSTAFASSREADELQLKDRTYLYSYTGFETKPLRDGCNARIRN